MVAGSGTIVPFTWILSITFWRLPPFDCPPVSSIRSMSNGALLASAGTTALTMIVPAFGITWL